MSVIIGQFTINLPGIFLTQVSLSGSPIYIPFGLNGDFVFTKVFSRFTSSFILFVISCFVTHALFNRVFALFTLVLKAFTDSCVFPVLFTFSRTVILFLNLVFSDSSSARANSLFSILLISANQAFFNSVTFSIVFALIISASTVFHTCWTLFLKLAGRWSYSIHVIIYITKLFISSTAKCFTESNFKLYTSLISPTQVFFACVTLLSEFALFIFHIAVAFAVFILSIKSVFSD